MNWFDLILGPWINSMKNNFKNNFKIKLIQNPFSSKNSKVNWFELKNRCYESIHESYHGIPINFFSHFQPHFIPFPKIVSAFSLKPLLPLFTQTPLFHRFSYIKPSSFHLISSLHTHITFSNIKILPNLSSFLILKSLPFYYKMSKCIQLSIAASNKKDKQPATSSQPTRCLKLVARSCINI